MKSFEIIAALLLAAAMFIIFKVIGMVVKIAAFAALFGFVAGLVLTRIFRR